MSPAGELLAGLALAADADAFAIVDAGGDFDRNRFQVAVGPLDGDGHLAAFDGRGEGDGHLVLEIGTAGGRSGSSRAAASAAATKLLEEIRESARPFVTAAPATEDIVQIEGIRLRAGEISSSAAAAGAARAEMRIGVAELIVALRFSASLRISNAL